MGINNTKDLTWIRHENLPHQAIAILDHNNKKLTVVDLKSGTSRVHSVKVSGHHCCGIVTIDDEVYAVTNEGILKVHGDGSVTTLRELESVDWYSQIVSFQKKIYIIQPNNKNMLCFDPDDNDFNDTLPGCGLGHQFCASSSHSFLFAMGGKGTENSAMKFSPLENTWTEIASMRMGRLGAAAAFLNKKIYVIGGWVGIGEEIKSAEFYSPDDDTWTRIPNMNIGRAMLIACVIDNQLYAIGGSNNSHENSVEVYDENQWMMVIKFEHKDECFYACIWPHSPSGSSKRIDEEYQKLKQSHATTMSKSIGEKGGKFEISGCTVRLPSGALKEEKEITFLARVAQNQEKGLLSITPALECDPPMKLDKAATVTMRTSISANAGETIPVTLFTQKHRQDKWETTEQLSLREKNEVQFKVTECSGMKVAAKSQKGKFHLISDFYIHSPTAMTAVIFSKDKVFQSLTRKELLENGYHKFALISHDVQGQMGSDISVSMEHKEPVECSVTDGLPSTTFKVDEDYLERGKQAIYYELEPEPSDQCKRVRMLFGYKVAGEKEQYLPLRSKWPPTKSDRETSTSLTVIGDVAAIHTGDKVDKSVNAAKLFTGDSHPTITSHGGTDTFLRK